MSKTVLITGAAGFIGSHLTRSLLADGANVIGIDNESTGRRENIAELFDNPNFQYVCSDAGDESVLSELASGVDEVYHLAAAVGVALVASDPVRTIQTNIDLTQTLLRVLERRNRVRPVKLYFASTSEVYGRNPARIWSEDDELVYGPTTIGRWSYGLSKAIDEHLVLAYVRQFGLSAVIGRFFNVVGARQTGQYGMVLPRFVSAALKNAPLTVFDDGAQRRCFIHVSDVVKIIRELVSKSDNSGQIYNIGSSESISILDLAKKVIAQTGSKSTIEFLPSTAVYGENFEDCRWRTPDVSKLFSAIEYRPQFSLSDAISDIVETIRNA
ncbi:MAG: NAD-dependent epimerase/dehydratase family protein [Thermoguttaceae bacterium]|nr:NAD-dependent epimerase/dehydratase family protein [Thermoguttaceae bacterium]